MPRVNGNRVDAWLSSDASATGAGMVVRLPGGVVRHAAVVLPPVIVPQASAVRELYALMEVLRLIAQGVFKDVRVSASSSEQLSVLWVTDAMAAASAVANMCSVRSSGMQQALRRILRLTMEIAGKVGAEQAVIVPLWQPREALSREDALSRVVDADAAADAAADALVEETDGGWRWILTEADEQGSRSADGDTAAPIAAEDLQALVLPRL